MTEILPAQELVKREKSMADFRDAVYVPTKLMGRPLITRWWGQFGVLACPTATIPHSFRNRKLPPILTGYGPGGTTIKGALSYTDSRVTLTRVGIITLSLESKTCTEKLGPTTSEADRALNLKNCPGPLSLPNP